jgi:hypothetical protein
MENRARKKKKYTGAEETRKVTDDNRCLIYIYISDCFHRSFFFYLMPLACDFQDKLILIIFFIFRSQVKQGRL